MISTLVNVQLFSMILQSTAKLKVHHLLLPELQLAYFLLPLRSNCDIFVKQHYELCRAIKTAMIHSSGILYNNNNNN